MSSLMDEWRKVLPFECVTEFAIHSDDGLFDLPSDRLYPHIPYNQNGSSYRDIDEDMKKEFVIHLD